MKNRWFAVRAVPGSQRVARVAIEKVPDNETEEERITRLEVLARRFGETILERDCRRAGIEVFMPSFWIKYKHHKTKKVIRKRTPMFVGYAFVRVGGKGFEFVRKLDSVASFIRNEFGPVPFNDDDIGVLFLAEMERKRDFDIEMFKGETLDRSHRRTVLNRQLGLIMPKGRKKRIPLRMLAESEIDKLSSRTRAKVLDILTELKTLDEEDRSACNYDRSRISSVA